MRFISCVRKDADGNPLTSAAKMGALNDVRNKASVYGAAGLMSKDGMKGLSGAVDKANNLIDTDKRDKDEKKDNAREKEKEKKDAEQLAAQEAAIDKQVDKAMDESGADSLLGDENGNMINPETQEG